MSNPHEMAKAAADATVPEDGEGYSREKWFIARDAVLFAAEGITRSTMSPAEHKALNLSAEFWNAFLALPSQHPDETAEFRHKLHDLQHMIMSRPTARGLHGDRATTGGTKRDCTMCDDTGYKDYAGFAMDPCDHTRTTPTAEKADVVEDMLEVFRSTPLHGDAGCDKLSDDEWRTIARAAIAALQPRPAEPAGEEPVCAACRGHRYFVGAPSTVSAGGELLPCPVCAPAVTFGSATPSNPDRLVEALRLIEQTAETHYTAPNGRRCSIEGSDGEMCSIIPFDTMEEVHTVLAALSAPALDGEKGE